MNKIDLSTIKERKPKKRNTELPIKDPKTKEKKESSFKPEMKTSQFENKKKTFKSPNKAYTVIHNQPVHQVTSEGAISDMKRFAATGIMIKILLELDVDEEGILTFKKGKETIQLQNKHLTEMIQTQFKLSRSQANNTIKKILSCEYIINAPKKDKKGNIVLDKKTGEPKLTRIYALNTNFFKRGTVNEGIRNFSKLYEENARELFKNLEHETIGILIALVPYFNKQTCIATTIDLAEQNLISEEEAVQVANEKFLEEFGYPSFEQAVKDKTNDEIGEMFRKYNQICTQIFYELFDEKIENFVFLNETQLAFEIGIHKNTLNKHAKFLREKNVLFIYKGADNLNRYIINPDFLSKINAEEKVPVMESYLNFIEFLFKVGKLPSRSS